MITLKIKKLHPNAVIPKYANNHAACFDLTVTEIEYIPYGKAIIKFGIAVEVPEGYKLVIVPRSSFTHKGYVMVNSPGQVDSDYRGELQMRIEAIPNDYQEGYNNGVIGPGYLHRPSKILYPNLPFKVGDRAAQAYIEKVIQATFEEVEELSPTDRGENGFGSTGK